MPDNKEFRSIMNGLKKDVDSLAGLTVRKYRKQAVRDGKKLLRSMQHDLRRWSDLVESSLLTTEDFEWLVHSQTSSTKMTALENSGLALTRVDQFRGSLTNIVVDVIFDSVLGPEETTVKKKTAPTRKPRTTTKAKAKAKASTTSTTTAKRKTRTTKKK